MSLYSAGHCQQALGRPLDEVIATFLRASEAVPSRAEALHAASRVCRENKRFAEGCELARRGLAIFMPASGLFVVPWIYDYGLLDEFAVNAYWIERYQDCLDACERLLREDKMPSEMRDRVKKNAELAKQKIRTSLIQSDFLVDLLRPERLTTIVDIGANPIDSLPPYKLLLDQGRCRVFGFEPQTEALDALDAKKSDRERYLTDVVGDGKAGLLRICRATGMTSLFVPDQQILRNFPGFNEWGQVIKEVPVKTRRLDDISEIEVIDFLRMDAQGAELSILQNGHERLKSAVRRPTCVCDAPLNGRVCNSPK
jgi:FkbM family methyltransferase